MHVAFDDAGSGAAGMGASAPLLSRDRRWLAFLRAEDLWLARTDGGVAHRVTTHNDAANRGKFAAELLITSFSPDGTSLLFHVGEVNREDDAPPLPKGTLPGFYLVKLDGFTTTRLPQIEGFGAFRGDSKSVVESKYVAASDYRLREYPLALGATATAPKTLRTSKDPYGFSQLVIEEDRLAFGEGNAIVVGAVDGGPLLPVTPKGSFAEYQFPTFAPGGAHLAYERQKGMSPSIEVVPATPVAGAPLAAPLTLCTQCSAVWYDATRLVVASSATPTAKSKPGLRLVGLDGKSVSLAPKGTLLKIGTN
jgi:hypothetical protein